MMLGGRWTSVDEICQEAKPWDIIEILLPDTVINHFVLYVGNGAGVHVIPAISDKKVNLITAIASTMAGFVMEGGIKERILLKEYGDFKARVNNLEFEARSRKLVQRSPDEIEREAKKGIENGRTYVGYSLTFKNCEHYCVLWKYKTDSGFSPQAKAGLIGAAGGAVLGATIGSAGGPLAPISVPVGAAVGAVYALVMKKRLGW